MNRNLVRNSFFIGFVLFSLSAFAVIKKEVTINANYNRSFFNKKVVEVTDQFGQKLRIPRKMMPKHFNEKKKGFFILKIPYAKLDKIKAKKNRGLFR